MELTPKKGDVKEVEDLLSDKQVLVAEAHSLEVDFSFGKVKWKLVSVKET